MKLSEIKGERALDVIADLIEPVSVMVQDEEFKLIIRSGDKIKVVKYLLKEHKREILQMLALINGEDPETYEPTLIQLPMMVMELFDDPDVMNLFGLQDQSKELASSGPATENTEAPRE